MFEKIGLEVRLTSASAKVKHYDVRFTPTNGDDFIDQGHFSFDKHLTQVIYNYGHMSGRRKAIKAIKNALEIT